MISRWGGCGCRLQFGDSINTDLEAVDACQHGLAVAGIGIENEFGLFGAGEPGKRIDLAGRGEHECPPRGSNLKVTNFLCQLGLEVALSVGSRNPDAVSGSIVDEFSGFGNSGVGVHAASLPGAFRHGTLRRA
jgi:hypothetical protein